MVPVTNSGIEDYPRSLYSSSVMSNGLSHSTEEAWRTEVQQLENRIHELISLCNTLREENRGLRGKVQQIGSERDLLREKTQYAAKSVESILATVQVLEKES
jgi:cell division protein ZapB